MEWKTTDGTLTTNLKFKSQTDLAEFILKAAKLADEMNHHPDYKVHSAFKLEISLFTHSKNQITELDHKLAEKISEISTNL